MQQPDATFRKLLMVLHRAFVEARNLAEPGSHLHDLADTFEVVPELMARPDEGTVEQIRAILAEYQARRAGGGYEYVSLLDETPQPLTWPGS